VAAGSYYEKCDLWYDAIGLYRAHSCSFVINLTDKMVWNKRACVLIELRSFLIQGFVYKGEQSLTPISVCQLARTRTGEVLQ